MKKIILLSLLVLSIFTACKKDNADKKEIDYGVYATKDNTAWAWAGLNSYTGYVDPAKKDSLFIRVRIGEENLYVRFKSKGTGTYTQPEFNATFYTTVGLDVVTNRYKLSNDSFNQLKIKSYDEAKNIMTGSFNFTLIRTYGDVSSSPDKIAFTSGSFKLPVITYFTL